MVEIRDPAALDTQLARIRTEYNTIRLHASIGYLTPMTSITAAGQASAAPAPPASAARKPSGSSRIEPRGRKVGRSVNFKTGTP